MGLSVLQMLLGIALVATPAWYFADALTAAAVVCALLLGTLLRERWHTRRLAQWLSQEDGLTEWPWKGVWAEIVQRIQRLRRQNERHLDASEQRLQYFLRAIQASPNGVTLLDAEGRIEWCNATASSHLGLDAKRDVKQHIVHLLRDPIFSRYFAQDHHETEVTIDGRSHSLTQVPKLSIQLHAYGEGQLLSGHHFRDFGRGHAP
jgi:two-component system, OmpR family, phosphate regulon sensor histidine kinase PhoR